MSAHRPAPDPVPNQVLAELAHTRTQLVSLQRALAEQGQLIGQLKPTHEVRYVVTEKVVLVGKDETLPDLPEHYTFKVNEEIPVAEFSQSPEGYRFQSHDLTFTTDVVISEQESVASVRVESTGAPGQTFQVPSQITVQHVRDHEWFEPHLGLGISGSAPDLSLTASLYSPLIHPNENLDVLGLRVSGNDQTLLFGIDAVGYNLGSRVPFLTDTWIYGGASTGILLQPQVTVTLGSKL